ncbi:MAG: class I SAM-dependent methyltransferase [Candidatus Heimdallarchaeota archaeon]
MTELSEKLASSAAREIERKLNSISGGEILDVCTAKGDFIQTMKEMLKDYRSFVGIDISAKDLKSAKNEFNKQPVKFLQMNAETLEFQNDSFDTVCMSYSLHHLDEKEKVLAEMKRVLKENGYSILQEMYCDGQQSEAQKTDILTHHWDAKVDSMIGIPHKATFTKQELKEIVAAIGLKEFPVKCLFCDNKLECANPKNEGIINFTIKEINETLTRLQKHSKGIDPRMQTECEKLNDEGEKLIELAKKTGAAPPSQLFVIGRN